MRSFAEFGFLSDEIESYRINTRAMHKDKFDEIEQLYLRAVTTLEGLTLPAEQSHVAAATMWLKCLASCQATVLLAERGVGDTGFSTMRTALEALLVACALWRNPALAKKFIDSHIFEIKKQANGIIKTDNTTPPNSCDLLNLNEIIKVEGNGSRFCYRETAELAGLTLLYENSYRTYALAGAHATPRSAENYLIELQKDEFIFDRGLHDKNLNYLLSEVSKCISIGINRFEESLGKITS
jgi:hypothetical protein